LTAEEPRTYRFGGHTLDARERRLLAHGVAVPLKPRAFDILLYLVERAGHLVPKEELLSRLWPDSVVEESTLAKNIWLIRRALAASDGGAASTASTEWIETVPRTGYRFLAPVERVGPEPERPETEPGEEAVAATAPAPGRRPGRRALLGVGAVLIVVLALLALLAPRAGVSRRPPHPRALASPPAAAAPPRAAVAVLGFANLSRRSDSAWLATALTEMMSADLAAGERLRLVPGAEALELARTLPPAPGVLGRDALATARSRLAADYVVQGSYLILSGPEGEVLRLDVVLQSTASGETVGAVSGTGVASRLFALVDDAAAQLRARLGLVPPASQATAAAAAVLPTRPEAARLYAEGLAKLRQYDALGARPLLARAIALEGAFPLAHVALSQALAALGYDAPSIAEAKRAAALSAPLSRAQQLEIAAGLAEAQKDWTAAAATERSLLAFFPDNLEYGLSLARTLTAGGKAAEALTVLAALRRQAPASSPAKGDPRLDLAAAEAAGALSDWPGELAAVRRAEAAARARHLDRLLGEARLDEAGAEDALGETRAALAARTEAAHLFHALGDANAEAGALLGLANARGDRGDTDGALAGYRQVLATYERTGNRKGAAHAWSDLANTSWLAGDVEGSLRGAGRELALSREINDRRGIVWGLAALGNALADQGEIEKALAMQGEALVLSREMGDREYTAFCLGALADTHLAAGDLEAAERGYTEALALCRSLHDASGAARHEDDRASVLFAEDRLAEADRAFQDALAARGKAGEEDAAAQTRMSLAQLRIEEGHPAEGLALARQSAQAFAAMHQSGNTALALATAALAETALHQLPAAAADGDRAQAAIRDNRQNQPHLFVLLAQSRVEAAAGHLAAARSLAEAAHARAGKARALAFLLEARLLLGELDLRDPARADAGASRLRELAQEARARKFLLIARKAETAAGRGSGAEARPL
jgi:DNA-binding winged helix-turn-helix (wHTH) protein/TolB-like protein